MKVRMNITKDRDGFRKGDIIDAKRFSDFTEDELLSEVGIPEIWEGDEIFLKMPKADENGCQYRYLCNNNTLGANFEILNDVDEIPDQLFAAATEAKKVYDNFIKAGFSKKQAFDFVSIILAKSLTI